MFSQKICCIVVRRGVCTGAEPSKFRLISEIRDSKILWVEDDVCKHFKTWRDLEEEFACALMVRSSQKLPPERRMFSIQAGDLYICRRGCLEPCKLPPCYDPVYPTFWETALLRARRLLAAAVMIGLLYGSYAFHIWGPSDETLGVILGKDGEEKVEQLGNVATVALSGWNTVIGTLFTVIKFIFPPVKEAVEEEDKYFIMNLEDDVKEKKELAAQPVEKDDENVYEDWELIYNFRKEDIPLSVEKNDDTDWLWMEPEANYINQPGLILPYDDNAKMLTRQRGTTLASIYTDTCSTWSVTKYPVSDDSVDAEPPKCPEETPKSIMCKKRKERVKGRINPKACTCPLGGGGCSCVD